MESSNITNLPPELQIEFIKSLIQETCYEKFKSICSSNKYFNNLCKENLSVLRPELNKCVVRKRLDDLGFNSKNFDDSLIDYLGNQIDESNRINFFQLTTALKTNQFPFNKGDSFVFLKNMSHMTVDERIVFVSFLISLLKNLNRFIPFILQIAELPIQHSKKEYLLNLSCNLIGVHKVFEKIILNPDLNLSEPFLDFFVKNLRFSIDKYIRDLDMMITGLQEEINMIFDPEDRQIMEEEYAPIIQKLESRMRIIQNAVSN